MLEEAIAAGTRIGLLATFEPSIPALKAELEEMARAKKIALDIRTRIVTGALAALHEGQPAEHDRRIAAAAAELEDCDALVLGQFSMASAAECIPQRRGRTVLTSPVSAVPWSITIGVPSAACAVASNIADIESGAPPSWWRGSSGSPDHT